MWTRSPSSSSPSHSPHPPIIVLVSECIVSEIWKFWRKIWKSMWVVMINCEFSLRSRGTKVNACIDAPPFWVYWHPVSHNNSISPPNSSAWGSKMMIYFKLCTCFHYHNFTIFCCTSLHTMSCTCMYINVLLWCVQITESVSSIKINDNLLWQQYHDQLNKCVLLCLSQRLCLLRASWQNVDW